MRIGIFGGRVLAISPETLEKLLLYQQRELTEHHIYKRLAATVDPPNRRVLERLAEHELRHHGIWRSHTGQEVRYSAYRVWLYRLIRALLGFTFAVKLLEKWEQRDQDCYADLQGVVPEARAIREDECEHEAALLDMLDETGLRYTGSVVLGLSDALVELTGALSGLTFALQNNQLIALTGTITGVAAALSMGASEYLSTKAEETVRKPRKAAVYTSGAYLIAVFALVWPFLTLTNPFWALGLTLSSAVVLIGLFNFYIAIARDEAFRPRFVEMALLSFGVAGVSFLLGLLIRSVVGVDI